MAAVSTYVRCCTRVGLVLAALWALPAVCLAQSLPELLPPPKASQDEQPELPPSNMPRFPGGHVVPEGQGNQPAYPTTDQPGPLPPAANPSAAMEPETLPNPDGPDALPTPPPLGTPQTHKVDPTGKTVVDVRVVGNESIPTKRIASQIKSRPGRTFESAVIRDDIRALNRTRWFIHVEAEYLPAPDGVVLVFRVVERQRIQYIKFLGNTKSRRKALEKKSELKVGDPLDPYSIERAREAIAEFYREAGFNRVRVEVLEGTKRGDKGAVFLIDEGEKQRISDVEFVGNQIASDGRLKTQIQSKPPFLGIFGGYVDRDKIDADIERLTAYYRSLGFFQARVGVEPEFNEELDRLKLTFVIHEGVRYKVRNVTVAGVTKFHTPELMSELQLKQEDYFDQPKMQGDVEKLKEVYGAVGYIFADVQAEPRFLEEPGTLDLVYTINEGHRYRVGRIDVQISGENPHTRIRTVLNRLDLRPGDVVDIRKLRDAERRLRASGLFRNEPHLGVVPKILVQPAEMETDETLLGQADGNVRGQSPDRHVVQKPAVVTIHGQLKPGPADILQPQESQPQAAVPGTSPAYPSSAYQALAQPGQHYAAPQQVAAGPATPGHATAGPAPHRPWQRTAAPQPQQHQAAHNHPYPGQQPAQQANLAPPAQHGGAHTVPYAAQQHPGQMQQVPASQSAGVNDRQPAAPAAPGERLPWRETVRYQSPDAAPTGWTAPASTYSGGARYSSATSTGGYRPATRDPNPNPTPPPPNTRLAQAPPPAGLPSAPGMVPPPPGPGAPVTLPPPPGGATVAPIIPPGGYINLDEPDREAILIPQVEETQTGRLSFGVGVNSEAGVVGNIVLDEQNFDIARFPRSFSELGTGSAFRGAGQRLRIEAVPGSEVQRYMFTFREPYLLDTPISFGFNAFYFDRIYDDWDEQRLGGNISLGYQVRPDLSVGLTLRAENVNISNPAFGAPPELLDVVGDNGLYSVKANIVHDTRDSAFLPTEGHYIELAYEQNFGDFDFGRPSIEGRQYYMLRQRPDGSGRHVLSLRGRAGITGSQTPVFENFFAGGFSTLRGFDFRGASPVKQGVIVGGELMMLGSVEYMFPLTADDMLRGVVFCDFGTVEEDVRIDADNFRVAPGVGLRITIPAMGPAPIALDFAYPVLMADTDDKQVFSFYVGLLR